MNYEETKATPWRRFRRFIAALVAVVALSPLQATVPATTGVAYSEMTIAVIETRPCDYDECVITIDTASDPGFMIIFR